MLTIVDSAPKCSALLTTDYSFQKTGSIFTGSIVYGFDIIDVVQFSTEDNFKKGKFDLKSLSQISRDIRGHSKDIREFTLEIKQGFDKLTKN